jgi:hypothetical protein
MKSVMGLVLVKKGIRSIVNNKRPGGRFREARNREDNNLGGIKMKIPSFKVDLILRHILSGRRRWSSSLIPTTTQRQRR